MSLIKIELIKTSPYDRTQSKAEVGNNKKGATASMISMPSKAEIEKMFGKEVADKSQCLAAYDGMATMIFCATEPGMKTRVHVDHTAEHGQEFTSKTGYFSYIKYVGVWDLEKLE